MNLSSVCTGWGLHCVVIAPSRQCDATDWTVTRHSGFSTHHCGECQETSLIVYEEDCMIDPSEIEKVRMTSWKGVDLGTADSIPALR